MAKGNSVRVKNESVFVAKDLGTVIGEGPGSKILRKVIDVLRPDRSRVPGESIELEGHEIPKGFLAAELFRHGTGSKLVARTLGMAHHWIRVDSQKDCAPGYLALYSNRGDVYLVRYCPRYAFAELAERLAKTPNVFDPLPPGKEVATLLNFAFQEIPDFDSILEIPRDAVLNPSCIILLDLNKILVEARERVDALRDSLPSDFPVEQWLDAAVMASQIRDEVDSVEKDLEK